MLLAVWRLVKKRISPGVFVHTAERGVELQLTPAETSQKAFGERGGRLNGEVDMELQGGTDRWCCGVWGSAP